MPPKLALLVSKPTFKPKSLSEQGFSLIESLIAVLVISTVIVAMTPPIMISVATRVQTRRAEQAMQLAQGEVDKIRVLVEQGKYTNADLPPVATIATTIRNVSPPSTLVSSPTGATAIQAFRVDLDKDNTTDFFVQTFRDNNPAVQVAGKTLAFQMGVRVYSGVAANNLSYLRTDKASLKLTTGEGNQRTSPLAVIYTTVVRNDSKISLEKYRDYLTP